MGIYAVGEVIGRTRESLGMTQERTLRRNLRCGDAVQNREWKKYAFESKF